MDDAYISTMLNAYVECALWSSMDESDEDGGRPMDENYGLEDIADDALASMRDDVDAFARFQAEHLAGIDPGQAGHDFWLTRNGHGAGFWDRGLGDVGNQLTDACRPYGESYLYIGDDGLVYVS